MPIDLAELSRPVDLDNQEVRETEEWNEMM